MLRIQVYKDKKGEWRWRFRARNNRVIADSGEGYKRKAGAVRAAWHMLDLIVMAGGNVDVVVV